MQARRQRAGFTQARPAGGGDRRHHLLHDAGGLCPRNHRGAVGVELACGSGPWWARAFGFVALVLASVNIFGGFLVTERMLGMYKKKG